jgi:ubiquinone/menaquinone biosynthesis C-methylase UbiE
MNPLNIQLKKKYRITAQLYDILDWYWECQYRKWRPKLVADVSGRALEAGVGTGKNLPYYSSNVTLTGFDLSPHMVKRAKAQAAKAACRANIIEEDASALKSIPDARFDWYISTFMYCVMPDLIQPQALRQMARVLVPGGRFKIVEMIYSKQNRLRLRQSLFAPFVEMVYGARFDRHTMEHIQENPDLKIEKTSFLKDDTYLLIEGFRK